MVARAVLKDFAILSERVLNKVGNPRISFDVNPHHIMTDSRV